MATTSTRPAMRKGLTELLLVVVAPEPPPLDGGALAAFDAADLGAPSRLPTWYFFKSVPAAFKLALALRCARTRPGLGRMARVLELIREVGARAVGDNIRAARVVVKEFGHVVHLAVDDNLQIAVSSRAI